jgi:hypothetical protein
MVLFGGDGDRGYLDDAWLFDVERDTWESVNTGRAPFPRTSAAMTYDSTNNVPILFGGLGEDVTDLQDTWIFDETDTGEEWIEIRPSRDGR